MCAFAPSLRCCPSALRAPSIPRLDTEDMPTDTCTMVQARKRRPMSPRQASACCRPVDDLLDPTLFKALGDPTRLRLFGCLVKCGRACSVTELAACCSVDLSVVSRHLAALARAGLVDVSKQGRVVSYTVRYATLCATLRSLADAVEEHAPAACCEGGRCGPK